MNAAAMVYDILPPAGMRKDWDPCSMNLTSAGNFLRARMVSADWGDPIRCVLWENLKGTSAVVVGEYANGRRAEFRRTARNFALTLTWWKTPEARLDRAHREMLVAA